jgi:gallate dioxygenase
MREALSANIKCLHRSYYLPSMTGIATAIYENEAIDAPADIHADHRRHVGYQLAGAEALEGTYPFTQARSVKAFRINRFVHDLINAGPRAAFLADEEQAYEAAALTREERDLVRRRDWRGMIRYGVSFFMLEKLGAVTGASNLHIYAAMRGETLEQFQRTRNAPGALYSVAGKDTPQLAWDKEPAT